MRRLSAITGRCILHFKGGKGIATSAGVLLGIAPAAVGIGLLSWIFLFVASRYVSIASIGAAIVVPVVSWTLYSRKGLLTAHRAHDFGTDRRVET